MIHMVIQIDSRMKVRKSDDEFPISTGQAYRWEQPATLLHIGKYPLVPLLFLDLA